MNQRKPLTAENPSFYASIPGEDGAIVPFGEIEAETAEDCRDACHVALGYRPMIRSVE